MNIWISLVTYFQPITILKRLTSKQEYLRRRASLVTSSSSLEPIRNVKKTDLKKGISETKSLLSDLLQQPRAYLHPKHQKGSIELLLTSVSFVKTHYQGPTYKFQ